jgi:hypothetical protein
LSCYQLGGKEGKRQQRQQGATQHVRCKVIKELLVVVRCFEAEQMKVLDLETDSGAQAGRVK